MQAHTHAHAHAHAHARDTVLGTVMVVPIIQ